MNQYPHLFSPITIKNTVIPNRIFMPPMGTNLANVDGTPSRRQEEYYALRAEGGAGLITIENVCIDFPLGTNGTTQLRFDNDQYLPGFYRMVEKMRAFGSRVSVQLNHAGASAWPGRLGGRQPASASAVKTKSGGMSRALSVEEIHAIVKKFGEAALRAKRAGCDLVEIHGGHLYLLSQFMSPLTNHRTDEFGGPIENRARFAALVAREVRDRVGPQFPVVIRVSVDELMPGGNTLADGLALLEHFAEYVDVISVSAGLPDNLELQIDKMSLEDGWRAYMAKAVRDEFKKPVVVSGNIRNPEVAERLLGEGYTDFVGIGRGLIADPFWPRKARLGRTKLLRRCISCNIGCADNRIAAAKPIRCTINPDIFHADPKPALKNNLRVTVIGGGVAGLEAACTSAEAGCEVSLLEKESQLGGLAGKIAAFPAKYRIGWFVEYLEERARSLPNLKISLSSPADRQRIESLKPDIVIASTGAAPLLPSIAGLKEALEADNPKVFSIFGLMDNLEKFKGISASNIAVVGGGAVGLDVAEFFADQRESRQINHKISIVEMLPTIGRDLDTITKGDMLKMLKAHAVDEHVETKLALVRPGSLGLEKDGKHLNLDYDYAFICLGLRPGSPLGPDLPGWCREKGMEFLELGDARSARRIIDATREGRDAANLVRRCLAMRELCGC